MPITVPFLSHLDGGFYEDNLHKSSSVAAFEFPGKVSTSQNVGTFYQEI